MPDSREILEQIGRWKQQQGTAGVPAPVEAPPAPIPWRTPKKKKKSLIGLISRLGDPEPLTRREQSRLDIALKSDQIMNKDRTDEGALMNIRSQYPTY